MSCVQLWGAYLIQLRLFQDVSPGKHLAGKIKDLWQLWKTCRRSFPKDKAKDRTGEAQGPACFHHLPPAELSHTSSYLFLTAML